MLEVAEVVESVGLDVEGEGVLGVVREDGVHILKGLQRPGQPHLQSPVSGEQRLLSPLTTELHTIHRFPHFHIHGEGPYTWVLLVESTYTSSFTFKNLLRHYAKLALTHAMVSRCEMGMLLTQRS